MKPFHSQDGVTIYHGRCEDLFPSLDSESFDAIITDPPYPEIDREYGRMTESDWHAMMRVVVAESRRVLKPSGSAVYVLQPNSERVGRMRPWLWEFMAWTAREWNQVQDFWWWNITAPPTVHCHEKNGLARPSVKPCVWLGPDNCYRNQSAVLWSESDANRADRLSSRTDNTLHRHPGGLTIRVRRCSSAAERRGGVTPFNAIPIANTDSQSSSGAYGHGAGTPRKLTDWWLRYITPDGGHVLDPFVGAGTTLLSCLLHGRTGVGFEQSEKYCEIAAERIRNWRSLLHRGKKKSKPIPGQRTLFNLT